jgi:demethylmenaquinone methyltransferase/2-methoxy-6-polyprenyl-1,4-benzoquinol methylase
MYRVLRKGGKVVILEFSSPRKFPFKNIYNFYFKAILPKIGRLISKDSSAYTYLPESVQAFPDGEEFIGILKDVGYTNTLCKTQTFGISTIYVGQK